MYEEKEYEIPATITDIYRDFTDVLLGKLHIKKKGELISLEIKKRMFAFIAYEMLENKNFEIKQDEFFSKIENYLNPKGITIDSISRFENFLENSGIVYINENRVGFKHLSFLEYFAAYHIHSVRSDLYPSLIKQFNDVNWQNTAVFYAGIAKDMPWFIEKLIDELPGDELKDIMINSGGLGYLSQALYLTDVSERVKLIEKALDELCKATGFFKELTKNGGFFKDQPMHILKLVLSHWFNENFKSVTLISPLKECFHNLTNVEKNDLSAGNHELGLKLLMISTTLSSKYLDEQNELDKLLDFECVSKDPMLLVTLEMLLDISDIDSSKLDRKVDAKLKREIKRYKEVIKELTKEPAYRFDDDYKRTKSSPNKE